MSHPDPTTDPHLAESHTMTRHTCSCCAELRRIQTRNAAQVRRYRARKKAERALMEKITRLRGESGPLPPSEDGHA